MATCDLRQNLYGSAGRLGVTQSPQLKRDQSRSGPQKHWKRTRILLSVIKPEGRYDTPAPPLYREGEKKHKNIEMDKKKQWRPHTEGAERL